MISNIVREIIDGRRLGRNDDFSPFLTADLDAICDAADQIRAHFCGNHVELCTIINGKSGQCSENCKFCAQSAHNHTGVNTYPFLDAQTITDDAKANEAEGVHRYSIVTAGRNLSDADMQCALAAYQKLHNECSMGLCASHGFLSYEQFLALKQVGVTRYHENIETSRRFFPQICTTHSYDDKIESIRLAQKAGLAVCSGGIIGMGETWGDRIDMAISLSELGVLTIPVNALMPIAGTPLQARAQVSGDDILRTVAIFRLVNPTAQIRLAAGRSLLPDCGKTAFHSGANATITGNMLTTSGSNIAEDKKMLSEMGFDIAHREECAHVG